MASALPSAKPVSAAACLLGRQDRSPPWVRSRSHGRPSATSLIECVSYWTTIQTSLMPLWEVGEREVDQAIDTGEGERRLGARLGQHVHPAALSTSQHQRQGFLSWHSLPLLLLMNESRRPRAVQQDGTKRLGVTILASRFGTPPTVHPFRPLLDLAGAVSRPVQT